MSPWGPPAIACLLLAAASAAWPAEEVLVEARRRDDGVEVHARAFVAAPVSRVWQVLTDYERLPEFIPGISRSVVRERRGRTLLLEQTGEARFLFFSFPIQVQLAVTESAPDWVVSRAVGGNVRRMVGRYELLPDAARGGVLLLYSGLIEPDFSLPPLVGTAALRATAEEQFRAMAAEMERPGDAAR